jgi:hypothetical protein
LFCFLALNLKDDLSQKSQRIRTHLNETMSPHDALLLDPLLLLRTRKIFYAARKRASSRLTHSWLVSLKAMLYYNFFVFSSLLSGYAMPPVLACSRCCRSMVMMIIIILRPAGCCFLQMTRHRHFCQDFFLPSTRQCCCF